MLQVVSSGLQDTERLNATRGQPSVDFYKSVMHKRTRWASQWRRVEFDNLADFGKTATCTLPIIGELITRITLVVQLPDIYTPQITAINEQNALNRFTPIVGPSWAWTNAIGHAICSDVQLLIGDQIVDRFDSQQLEVIDEFERAPEHFDSTNQLIARDPSAYSDQQTIGLYNTGVYQPKARVPQTNPQTLEIVFPFWFNKGPSATPLPIQALYKDKVQLRCSFRGIQDLVYTSTRINPLNPPLSDNQGAGPLPNIEGCGFFVFDPYTSTTSIYDATSSANLMAQGLTKQNPDNLSRIPYNPFPGRVSSVNTMPSEYHFTDAYWIVEYVSLEDREASAFRMADMEIMIPQHKPLTPVITEGADKVRIQLEQTGLVRDLMWVAQRVEAPTYNAHFLFSRDLSANPVNGITGTPPCDLPWWPNAVLPDWDYGDGYIVPAFSTRNSDPLSHVKMTISGLPRFEHEAPSFYRSLIPALNCKRVPLVDRYIYRYDFGYWPSGGLAETLRLPSDEPRGCANWDKLPKRELILTMNQGTAGAFDWETDTSQEVQWIKNGDYYVRIDTLFSPTTQGLSIELNGADPGYPDENNNTGNGATIKGVIDLSALRRRAGFFGVYARLNNNGSASLVMRDATGYTWLAVAGGGGYGTKSNGGGGWAGTATRIGWQGGNVSRTHDASTIANGIIVYSNVAKDNDTSPPGTSFVGPIFALNYDGIFQNLQLTFTINTSTITQPITIKLIVNPLGTPTEFVLHSPTSTIYAPMHTYTILYTAGPPISLTAGTQIQVSLSVASGGNPFYAKIDGISGDLACRITIKNTSGEADTTLFGGGGGGLASVGDSGIGLSGAPTTGIAFKMPTSASFVTGHQQTGATCFVKHGGDGYYGGGAGTLCGGGGGSYVSKYVTQVVSNSEQQTSFVNARFTALKQVVKPQPSYIIYSWITRYTRLRINSGRGALMFNSVS